MLARIALKDEASAYTMLELKGPRKRVLHAWLNQARVFYANALKVKEVGNKLAQLGVTRSLLQAGQQLTEELRLAHAAQSGAVGAGTAGNYRPG